MRNQCAANIRTERKPAKPILKWAGGKGQMLGDILPRVPQHYGKYIEPFCGGAALFFALDPQNGIIADSNPELINVYEQVANNVEEVIRHLSLYENTEAMYYAVRAQNWLELSKAEAAARMIYLNHTCFNGLYRVNSSMYLLVNIRIRQFAIRMRFMLRQKYCSRLQLCAVTILTS